MFRIVPLFFLILFATLHSAVAQTPIATGAITTTGSELLSVNVNGTVYGRNRMVPGNVTGYAGAAAGAVLVRGGTLPPANGSRGTLTGDWFLDTGVINAGAGADAMTIVFPQPIVNRAGPDIVIFEINTGNITTGVTGDACFVKINGITATVATTNWGNSGYAITSADVYNTRNAGNTADITAASISDLENAPLNLSSADINQTIFGVAFDLSQFGVADGASVSSITIWSAATATAVDPVLVTGLITPPEQTNGPVIEELMANNKNTLEDEDLEYPDWVEIYNGTGTATNLSGWKLSDDPLIPEKWIFPSIPLQPYESTYVFCSAKNKFSGAHAHTNFKLKKEGGALLLTRPDGSNAGNLTYPAQVGDISWGALGAAQTLGYLETPTPGVPNAGRQAAGPPIDDPIFDKLSAIISAPTTLTITPPLIAPPGAQIRYLLDNNSPTETSPLYATPLAINAGATVAVRVFAPGYLPSRVSHRSFSFLASDIASSYNGSGAAFSSNLPIIVLDSYGVAIDSTTDPNYARPGRFANAAVYDVNATTGRASLGVAPTLVSRAGVHVRGQSSSGFNERPYALEFWNEHSDDGNSVALLGMPANSDWVLQTLYTDKTFMRNYTMQQLMLETNGSTAGRRCRFVEVFFNQDNTTHAYGTGLTGDYRGVYLLIESIKRGRDRVDVQKLNSEMSDPALISGGYIFKKDKTPYSAPFTTPVISGAVWTGVTYDISAPTPTVAQTAALRSYINLADNASVATGFFTPASPNYYGRWLNIPSFIDKQIWQETCREVDSYTFSDYYSKDRGQPLSAFPFWDVDRSLGNANYGTADNSLGWRWWTASAQGYAYYPKLFADPEFTQAYWDRWWKLRRGAFATSALMQRIESTALILTNGADPATLSKTSVATLQNPAARHFKRWATLGVSSYGSGPVGQVDRTTFRQELDLMKSFLSYRVDWIDSQSPSNLRPPDLLDVATLQNRFGGTVPAGFQGALVNPNDNAATLYYTVNGVDPRAFGGGVATGAQPLTGGVLPFTTLLVAGGPSWKYLSPLSDPGTTWTSRSFDDSTWSAGTAPIGYSETGLGTTLAVPTQTTTAAPTPVYFRKVFSISNAATVTGLQLEIMVDDGAVVYLNGNEVARVGMPYAPTVINFATLATGAVDDSRAETTFNFIRIDPSKLVEGSNLIAVEVHQALYTTTPPAADMRFDLKLKATRAPTAVNPLSFSASGSYTVRSRLRLGTLWSPLTESTFVVNATQASAANVVISELHYHPTNPSAAELNAGYDARDFEFLELLNVGTDYVDLAGAQFSEGVLYTFPSNNPALTVLAPGQRCVISANPTAFPMRYGSIPDLRLSGPYTGSLDNSGERITLLSATNAIIAQLTYGTLAPWPVDADGPGYSLVLNNAAPNLDSAYYNNPSNWRPSAAIGGAPGASKRVAFTGLPTGDSDGDGIRDFMEYATGSLWSSAVSRNVPVVSVAPFVVGGLTQNFFKLDYIRNLLADNLSYFVEMSSDLTTWAGDNATVVPVGIHHNGNGTATVTWRSVAPVDPTQQPPVFMRLRITP